MMTIDPAACPECGADVQGTVDLVPGVAKVNRFHDGKYDWDGETEIDWDGQQSDVDERGLTLVVCFEGHEFRARVDEE